VYVVGAHKPHVPLIKAAARSCINPNVWWQRRAWIPGTLANYRSHAHLFKDAHQPNRRLFAAKGLRMVNPLCPSPGPLSAPPPRLSWDDKWLLFKRLRRPGFRRLLTDLQHAEDGLHRLRQAGSLRGVSRDLRLIIFLDTARSQVAVREAYHRHVPTIALVNTVADPEMVTYPILARDSHPGFTRFFLEWLVKVANAAPGAAPRELAALRAQFDQHASNTAAAVETSTPVELLKSDAAP
jgi:ribosomal protein S2